MRNKLCSPAPRCPHTTQCTAGPVPDRPVTNPLYDFLRLPHNTAQSQARPCSLPPFTFSRHRVLGQMALSSALRATDTSKQNRTEQNKRPCTRAPEPELLITDRRRRHSTSTRLHFGKGRLPLGSSTASLEVPSFNRGLSFPKSNSHSLNAISSRTVNDLPAASGLFRPCPSGMPFNRINCSTPCDSQDDRNASPRCCGTSCPASHPRLLQNPM